ncbi:MAG TPA: threonine ammonia-lyase [Longimicrobiales bacterium]|nr:threonine ammonia-lyase [Longimicrobiales bacterium]
MTAPTRADVLAAAERIRDGIVQTPCTRSLAFADILPSTFHLKLENLQRTGSFKDRGSLNHLLRLSAEERARGVVTASAGNHGQGVAYHGGRLGIPVTVVMPTTAPLNKVANTRRYGARVVQRGTILDEAMAETRRLAAEEGLVMVPAFDHPDIIAGQGTVGLEILEQVPDVDTILVPVGGGGLVSGIGIAVKEVRPEVRLIGIEADAAPSARASREAGRVVEIAHSDTLADGIATKRVGDLTFPLIERYVDDLVSVGEEPIAAAILLLLEREKTVAEGAGAVPLAALLSGVLALEAEAKVVAVLSGGNIDINMISRIIDRGLVFDGRAARLAVKVRDRPGSLAALTRTVAELGANVVEVYHRRAFADISLGDVEIIIQMETRGREHVEEIIRALEALGHHVDEAH